MRSSNTLPHTYICACTVFRGEVSKLKASRVHHAGHTLRLELVLGLRLALVS